MGKIKLGLSRRTIDNKLQFGGNVETLMTADPTFATLAAQIAAMGTSKGTLQTKWSDYNLAYQAALQKYTEVTSSEADFDNEMTKLANDVENLSNGDVAIIKKAGMDVKNPASPPQVPSQVLNLSAVEGDSSGKMKLAWKKVKEAKSYNIEVTTDVNTPSSWAFKATSTKTKITVNGLISGTKYWFRVYAVGSAGDGAPSDPAVKYAP